MPKLTYAQQVIYKAVSAIESSFISSLKANTKTLVVFLTGKNDKPFHEFFASHKEIYGALPKANVLNVISLCGSLAEMGYLTKTSVDGNIYYATTSSDPFADEELLYTDKLSAKNKKLVNSIRDFVKEFCPSIKENEQENYFGFKVEPTIKYSISQNWFWISKSNDPKMLTFRFRSDPTKRDWANAIDFNETNVAKVIATIRICVQDYEQVLLLKLNRGAEYKDPFQSFEPSEPKRENPSSFAQTKEPEERPTIDFGKYIGERVSKVCINDGTNQMNALLSVGEASPFYYYEDTHYVSEDAKRLTEGKKNFDFSMRKWKLVAWSIASDNPNLIRNALVLNKKTKSIWIVLSVGDRRVVCISRNPFKVSNGLKTYQPEEIVDMLFNSEE